MEESVYQRWISFHFDQTPSRKRRRDRCDDEIFASLGECDVVRFSDAQVNEGIWELTSDLHALVSGEVPADIRLRSIRSIATLYRDCFATRCTPTLSHLDEDGSELNPICYMFWDTNHPLGYLGGVPESDPVVGAVFGVLSDTLSIRHPACQEAALHGLGHLTATFPERVDHTIAAFLKSHKPRNPDLLAYARAARTGEVQ